MNITTMKNQTPLPVTILSLDGKLDGTTYERLIHEAQKAYADGERNLILDLSQLTYISSAGLAALHRVALLFSGEKNPDQDEGWAAYRAIDRSRGGPLQTQVKLVGLTEQVQQVLDLVGFSAFFETFADLQTAENSFEPASLTT